MLSFAENARNLANQRRLGFAEMSVQPLTENLMMVAMPIWMAVC